MQREQHMTDPEMYTRWIQYGVFTPIFKTHSTASKYVERKIWAYPTHYPYLKAAIELRYQLSPYIYDAARQAYDTGVSICRPMYYHYPEEEKAYSFDEQNMFGDLILSTVLCTPAIHLRCPTRVPAHTSRHRSHNIHSLPLRRHRSAEAPFPLWDHRKDSSYNH